MSRFLILMHVSQRISFRGMNEYNVHDILVYGNGRCQMDFSCIIREE